MKYLMGILVIGVIVVGGYFLLRSPGSSVTTTLNPGESPSVEDTSVYKLIVIEDSVTIQHTGDDDPSAVTDTATVVQGDKIVTSSTGRARLSWPNGTITTLEPDTAITVQALSNQGNQSRITLHLGDIWSKVTRILGSDEYYEVQTNETVAAVRGTMFRNIYRNNRSMIQGIEDTVRVFVRNTDGTTDEASGTDITEESQVGVDASIVAMPAGQRKLVTRKLTQAELRDAVFERIQKERNQRDDQIDRQIRRSPALSPKITLTPRPSPTPAISLPPRLTPPLYPSIPPMPTDIPPISSILPYVSNLPVSSVKLDYVSPKVTTPGTKFSVNGSNFLTGRTPRINGVLVGYQPAQFAVIDSFTMFVTAPQLSPGVYEITVTTDEGTLVNLKPGITIQ